MLADFFRSFFDALNARVGGPLNFRFLLQPAMALIWATIDGIRDAKDGRPAWGWAVYRDQQHRTELLYHGWRSISKVFFLAVVLDLFFQVRVFGWSQLRIVSATLIGVVLALFPYVLARGPANRLYRRFRRGRYAIRTSAANTNDQPKRHTQQGTDPMTGYRHEPGAPPQVVETIGAWSVTLGILMAVLGVFAIISAFATTFISLFVVGSILVIRGLLQAIYAFLSMRRDHFWHNLFSGALSLIIGVLVLSQPAATAAVLVLLVIIFLLGAGIFRMVAAPIEHARGWGWEMVSGLLSLALGLLLLAGWPAISFRVIGLYIGIEVLSMGVVMTALPRAARSAGAGEAAWAGR